MSKKLSRKQLIEQEKFKEKCYIWFYRNIWKDKSQWPIVKWKKFYKFIQKLMKEM